MNGPVKGSSDWSRVPVELWPPERPEPPPPDSSLPRPGLYGAPPEQRQAMLLALAYIVLRYHPDDDEILKAISDLDSPATHDDAFAVIIVRSTLVWEAKQRSLMMHASKAKKPKPRRERLKELLIARFGGLHLFEKPYPPTDEALEDPKIAALASRNTIAGLLRAPKN